VILFGKLLRVGMAVACASPIELRAADEAEATASAARLWEELQALPPELAEALPEDLRLLLEEMNPKAWQSLFTVSSALGYRENVGLNSVAPIADSFGQLQVEALAIRQPQNGWEWSAILDGHARWYEGNPIADDEHFWFGRGEVGWTPWAPLRIAARVHGFWQDQVIDLTEGYGARTVASLKVAGGEAGASMRWSLWGGFSLEATSSFSRIDYQGVAEDNVVWGHKGELVWSPAPWLAMGVGMGDAVRDYDFRGEATSGGRIITDTILAYDQLNEQARLTLKWDARGDWKLEAKGSMFENRDGSSGFYDYDRERWGGTLSWELFDWEFRVDGEQQTLAYLKQTVGAGLTPAGREQEDQTWEVEAIYRWGEHWEVFGRFSADRSVSNEVESSYRDRTVMLGAGFTF
jgi:hypothetical protein